MKRFLLILMAMLASAALLFSCGENDGGGNGDEGGGENAGGEGSGEGNGEGENGNVFTPAPDTTVYDETAGFDYVKTDLTGFVQIDLTKYQPFTAKVNIAPPRLGENGGLNDVDIYVTSLLRAAKGEDQTHEEEFITEGVIGPGDYVKIYYRGYVVGDDGSMTEKDGMCNFTSKNPSILEIGSGQFVPGFEYSIIGKNPKDYAKFSDLDEDKKLPEGMTAMMVDCYFPYDYGSEDLQNKNAVFEVYVEGIKDYEAPEWNVEFLTSYLESRTDITSETLAEFEGEDLCEKFESYYADKLTKEYEEEKLLLAKDAIANDFFKAGKILKYPKANVDAFIDPYVFSLNEDFKSSGGSYNGSTYATLDGYACARLGITSITLDWVGYLRDAAKNYVSQRLIIHYLADALEVMPDEATFKTLIDEMKAEYLAEYVKQMLDRSGKTREDYTDEEYTAFLQDCAKTLFAEYDDEFFVDNKVYMLVVDKIAETVVITTPYDVTPDAE